MNEDVAWQRTNSQEDILLPPPLKRKGSLEIWKTEEYEIHTHRIEVRRTEDAKSNSSSLTVVEDNVPA